MKRKTSNLSIKASFKDERFNLKTIVVMFIIVDLFLVPTMFQQGLMVNLFYLIIFQVSLLISLMYGLRGQGKYKAMMAELQIIARNLDMDVNERDTRLVSLIHHGCLELGFIYEERNEQYGLDFGKKIMNGKNKKREKIIKNNKKGGKKKMGKLIIDEIVWKQIGYMIVGIWGFLGLALLDLLINSWAWSLLWIVTIQGIWYCLDVFFLFYIRYIFKLEVILTPVDSVQINPKS